MFIATSSAICESGTFTCITIDFTHIAIYTIIIFYINSQVGLFQKEYSTVVYSDVYIHV